MSDGVRHFHFPLLQPLHYKSGQANGEFDCGDQLLPSGVLYFCPLRPKAKSDHEAVIIKDNDTQQVSSLVTWGSAWTVCSAGSFMGPHLSLVGQLVRPVTKQIGLRLKNGNKNNRKATV